MLTRLDQFKQEVNSYALKHGITYEQAVSVLNDPRPEVYNWVDWDQLLFELRQEILFTIVDGITNANR